MNRTGGKADASVIYRRLIIDEVPFGTTFHVRHLLQRLFDAGLLTEPILSPAFHVGQLCAGCNIEAADFST